MTVTDINKRYVNSTKAFAKAKQLMPGGVNSPVRAYQSVARDPIVIDRGDGARVVDLDGNRYVDYVLSYGPLILGHAPKKVLDAIALAASKGTSFGMPTLLENQLAEMIINAVPSVQRVRMVNSGTEATMSAIRLARAYTKRDKVIKCIGCYHGHSDSLLVQAGSGALTLGVPSSPGVPSSITEHTLLVPFNDLEAVATMMQNYGDQIACMMLEPIAGNMGTIAPKADYLAGLRKLCDQYGVVLLFDEVMCGFRVAYGGAQSLYGVTPDLSCFGKVIGGGLPCAAYGGKAEIMDCVAPKGPMYQAGTLSGNPLAMAAGIATLQSLCDGKAYDFLETQSAKLVAGLKEAASQAGISVQLPRVGSMLVCYFTDTPVEDYDQATTCRVDQFTTFFNAMLDQGIVLPPSQYETWFLSLAHDDQVIQETVKAAKLAMRAVAEMS